MLTVQNNRWKNKETIVAKIGEVWAASLDSCKCGQQVWTAVLSIDTKGAFKGHLREGVVHHYICQVECIQKLIR